MSTELLDSRRHEAVGAKTPLNIPQRFSTELREHSVDKIIALTRCGISTLAPHPCPGGQFHILWLSPVPRNNKTGMKIKLRDLPDASIFFFSFLLLLRWRLEREIRPMCKEMNL